MKNEFIKVTVEKPWFSKTGFETENKFNKPNPKKRYIKILMQCLEMTYIRGLYPNAINPLEAQIRDMRRTGLLDRYKTKGSRGYFYKTTDLGKELLVNMIKNF